MHPRLRRFLRGIVLPFFCAAWTINPTLFAATPLNDRFSDATAISGNAALLQGDLTGATMEDGEPLHPGLQGTSSRSIWWKWTAPAKGGIVLNARASALYAKGIYIYTGEAVTNLTMVGYSYGDDTAQASVEPGVTYSIAVASGIAEGSVILSFEYIPAPPNDNFANRIVLSGPRVSVPVNLFGTSVEPGEPVNPDPLWPPFGNGAWWEWTAPVTGRLGYTLGTTIELFEGTSLSDLHPFNPENAPLPRVVAGQRLFIRCSKYPGNLAGLYNLDLYVDGSHLLAPGPGTYDIEQPIPIEIAFAETDEPVTGVAFFTPGYCDGSPSEVFKIITQPPWRILWQPSQPLQYRAFVQVAYASGRVLTIASDCFNVTMSPPANDRRENAIVIPPQGGTTPVVRLSGATFEPGEFQQLWSDFFGLGSAWWKWTPTQTARAFLIPPPDTTVRAFVGDAMDRVNLLPVDNTYEFLANAGQTYWIALNPGYAPNLPPSQLKIVLGSAASIPTNDNFADRLPLSGSGSVATDLTLATFEPGEPASSGKSLWWTWSASAAGVLELEVTALVDRLGDAYGGASVGVYPYRGTTVTQLTPVTFYRPGAWPDQSIRFRVAAGDEIHLQLLTAANLQDGRAFLRYKFLPDPPNDLFANRIAVSDLPLVVNGRISSTTWREAGEPQPFGFFGTVWWSWTSPFSGEVGMAIHDFSGNSRLAVFDGNDVSSLARVHGVTNYVGLVRFTVEQGHTYQLQVTGQQESDFILHISAGDSNDNFGSSTELTAPNQIIAANNLNATHEPGEPNRVPDVSPANAQLLSGSLWWHFTAPVSGELTLKHHISFWTYRQSWYGDTVSSLERIRETPITGDSQWNTGSFPVQQGQTVHVSLDPLFYESMLLQYDFSSLRFALPPDRAEFRNNSSVTFSLAPIQASIDGDIDTVALKVRRQHPDGTWTPDDRFYVYPNQLPGPPFTQVLSNFQAGVYEVTARAVNSTGQMRVSAPAVFAIGPSNDDFTNRIPATIGKWEVATMGGTSLEPFEQNFASDFSGSAWWQWQALWNGLVYIETTNIVAIYKGTNSAALVPVAIGTNGLSFSATQGEFYQIALLRPVGGANLLPASFTIAPAPQNDYFADRVRPVFYEGPLNQNFNEIDYDVKHATLEPGEPDHGVADATGSVWWEFTVARAGKFAVEHWSFPTNGATLRLYRGNSLGDLTPVPLTTISQYDSGADIQAGTYQLVLVTRATNVMGRIYLSFQSAAANDNFANAAVLSGGSGHVEVPFWFATVEPTEPSASQFLKTLWWKWTAPRSGYMDVVIPEFYGFPTEPWFTFEIFQGDSLSSLQPTLFSQRVDNLNYNLIRNYAVTQGQTYYFRAALGNKFPSGIISSFDFALSENSVTNANPENALPLEGSPINITGNTAGAGDGVLYYTWRASQEGLVYFGTTSPNIRLNAKRFDANSNLLAEVIVPPLSALHAHAGETYQIAISSPLPAPFDFTVKFVAGQPNDDFTSRRILLGVAGTFLADAPFSAGTFDTNGIPSNGRVLYFEWTAPFAGQLHIESLDGSPASSNIFVYDLASGQGSPRVIAGRTYQITFTGTETHTYNYWLEADEWLPLLDRADANFRFSVQGRPGSILRIDVSDNLTDWTTLGLQETTDGVLSLTGDLNQSKARFYRLTPLW